MELSNEKNSNEDLNIFKYTYFDCEIIERDRVVNYLDENIKYFIDTTNDKKKTEILESFFKLFLDYFNKLFFLKFSDKNEKNEFLYKIIEYSVITSSKKLRPIFIFLNSYIFDFFDIQVIEHFMLSIEMIHTFSLIHDDLPAIDNDEIRRGKESTWKKYGESFGILAGDALLAEAFNNINYIKNNIAINKNINREYFFELMNKIDRANFMLSDFTGYNGMIYGELLDVYYTGKDIDIDSLKYMYDKKTGKLILAAFLIGIIFSKNDDKENVDLIKKIATDVGFSYQLIDDLLEIVGDEKIIGKKTNSDANNHKLTLAKKLGTEKTRDKIKKIKENININIDNLKSVNKYKLNFYKFFINFIMDRDK